MKSERSEVSTRYDNGLTSHASGMITLAGTYMVHFKVLDGEKVLHRERKIDCPTLATAMAYAENEIVRLFTRNPRYAK